MRAIIKLITLAALVAVFTVSGASASQAAIQQKPVLAAQSIIKFPDEINNKQHAKKSVKQARPARFSLWVRIGRCEQPGNGYMGINWRHPGPTYQGGLGFWYGTWDAFKPKGFPAEAGQATWRQQMIVANRLYSLYGVRPWGCG